MTAGQPNPRTRAGVNHPTSALERSREPGLVAVAESLLEPPILELSQPIALLVGDRAPLRAERGPSVGLLVGACELRRHAGDAVTDRELLTIGGCERALEHLPVGEAFIVDRDSEPSLGFASTSSTIVLIGRSGYLRAAIDDQSELSRAKRRLCSSWGRTGGSESARTPSTGSWSRCRTRSSSSARRWARTFV